MHFIFVEKRKEAFVLAITFAISFLLLSSQAMCETRISGKVLTGDGKIATSGAVALEKGELHNNAFLAGGEINPDGTFSIPLPSGGPWGLHVYSEGYIYFPLQVQIRDGTDNEVPVILPLDGSSDDDPSISDIRFKKITRKIIQVSMRVEDPDNNLGPQMLAIDTKHFRSYRLFPSKGDIADKKANFPSGEYISPFIRAVYKKQDPRDWLFVVADHKCSNGPVYNGLNQSVFRQPVPHVESLRCEVQGIWKSNFEKIYRFRLESPGVLKGEQIEGSVVIDRMELEENELSMAFRFQGEKGKARLRLNCQDNKVILKGKFSLPGRTAEWIFTKLKNEKAKPTGKDLFSSNCTLCHFHDRTDSKVGPGLKGLFENPRLPTTGRPTDESTVRQQIQKGGTKMPSFSSLTEEEISAIINYLKTL